MTGLCRIPALCLALVVQLLLLSPALAAQARDCTYDRCALRFGYRASAVTVVQGTDAAEVGRIGLFSARIAPLEQGSDSVRMQYDVFRRETKRAGILNIISTVAVVAGTLIYLDDPDDSSRRTGGIVGLGVGVVVGIISSVQRARGLDALSRSMWLYNRALVPAP